MSFISILTAALSAETKTSFQHSDVSTQQMQNIGQKLPPAAYFYYVATGYMSEVVRDIVVTTGQEIAAKF